MNIVEEKVRTNEIVLNVASIGSGPAIMLLHGWPHTWLLWRDVMPLLARAGYRAIAPDLRGLGASERADSGYDLETLSDDVVGVLDRFSIEEASVVGIDAGAPIAFMTATRHPARVRRLAVCESLLGGLAGAEGFLLQGPPWWFGFHSVPGLAEQIVEGHEAAYLDWFLSEGSFDRRGIAPEIRDAFVAAYSGRDALRCGFEYYRAAPRQAAQIDAATRKGVVLPPSLALVGGLVGDAIYRQLATVDPGARRADIPRTGHLVPLDNPTATAAALLDLERAPAHHEQLRRNES